MGAQTVMTSCSTQAQVGDLEPVFALQLSDHDRDGDALRESKRAPGSKRLFGQAIWASVRSPYFRSCCRSKLIRARKGELSRKLQVVPKTLRFMT